MKDRLAGADTAPRVVRTRTVAVTLSFLSRVLSHSVSSAREKAAPNAAPSLRRAASHGREEEAFCNRITGRSVGPIRARETDLSRCFAVIFQGVSTPSTNMARKSLTLV